MLLLPLYHAIALILQFDGSLRVPKDPNPEVSHEISCKFLPKMASCASALLRENFEESDEHNNDNDILGTNGKILHQIDLTSADVEYEGLILGLSQVANFFYESLKSTNGLKSNEKTTIIIVRGDCKTVIDQMNTVSKPRKQRDYFNKATDLVEEIKSNFAVSFKFEHVLRHQNELCDSICHEVIQSYQMEIVATLESSIEEIRAKKPFTLPSSKKKRLKCRDTHFASLIHDLSIWDSRSQSRIPLSVRPYWLSKAALYAEQINDYVAMRLIGEALMTESEQWQKQGLHCMDKSYLSQMNKLGLKLIVYALEQMELHKEALKLISVSSKNHDKEDSCNNSSVTSSVLMVDLESFHVGTPFHQPRDDQKF